MGMCKECKNGLKRCEFSFKKYGSYYCDIECCLIENEDMPWRRSSDTCEKFTEKKKMRRLAKMSNVKKCPFCGGVADIYQSYSQKKGTWFVFVKCNMCGDQGKICSSQSAPSDENWDNEACERAVIAWNTRASK